MAKNKKNAEISPVSILMQEIAMTKNAIDMAYSNFENAVDPDLIDCFIYQLNSEQKRYTYLLKQAEKYEKEM